MHRGDSCRDQSGILFDQKERGSFHIPVLFFVVLGFVLTFTRGHFSVEGLVLLTLAFIGYLSGLFFLQDKRGDFPLTPVQLLSVLWLAFSLTLALRNGLIYARPSIWLFWFKTSLYANGFWALFYFLLSFIKTRSDRLNTLVLAGGVISIFIGYFLILKVSPSPHIDVFTILSKAADLFWTHKNPYNFLYEDIYGGAYTYQPRLGYWPIVAYLCTAGKLIAGDVRFAYILMHLMTGWGIYLLGKQAGLDFQTRLLGVLVWFTFPVSFFVFEQTWTEIIILPFLAFFAYFASQQKWLLAGVMAGLACSSKQYMIIFAVFSVLFVWRNAGHKKAAMFVLVASFTTLSTMLLFLVWDLRLFLERTVFEILRYDVRTDSLSWIAFFINRLHRPFPFFPLLCIKGVLFITALFVIFRKKNPTVSDLFLSQVILFAGVFLFARQAFCNYYYYLSFVLFLQIILMMPSRITSESCSGRS